jgi:enoyl-CoA hydratase/carnithine racemase
VAELKSSLAGGVARLTFDRPRVLNALSPALLSELIELCADLAPRDQVKVLVVEGAGTCFSAGADLPAFVPLLQGPDARATADLGRRAADAIAGLPQITVAAIHGHCVGGALVLAGACDIRIAADDARFVIPELDAGIPLAWGGMERLVRLAGETVGADWVLSGRPFGPDEALRAGFISRIVPAGGLQTDIDALAASISRKPRSVLRKTKEQLLAIRGGTFDAGEDAEALLSSLRDPEALALGRAYLRAHLGEK